MVYPNPVQGGGAATLLPPVSAGGDLHLEVFTLAFRKVKDFTVHLDPPGTAVTLDLTDPQGRPLANGLYYLVLSGGGHHWVLKLLVLR